MIVYIIFQFYTCKFTMHKYYFNYVRVFSSLYKYYFNYTQVLWLHICNIRNSSTLKQSQSRMNHEFMKAPKKWLNISHDMGKPDYNPLNFWVLGPCLRDVMASVNTYLAFITSLSNLNEF